MNLKNIWEINNPEKTLIEKIAIENSLEIPIATVLANRGLYEKDSIQRFLYPDIKDFYNPFLLADMDNAVERIAKAIENKQKITIYGDYDVDGITSTSILVMFLRELDAIVDYYIPNRHKEGYGINETALLNIKNNETDLVITVDTGIAANKQAKYAKEIQLDLIITDHHECQDELPEAIAVIDPKRNDCRYPFKMLAGVGVTFKLVHALAIKYNNLDNIWKYLELTAIGTIADIVPLVDENRIIVKQAFNTIENSWNLGIQGLLKISGAENKKITASLVGFQLGPRLNAAGRIGDANKGVELFLTRDKVRAAEISEYLDNTNKKRQELEAKITEEAFSLIEEKIDIVKTKVIVVEGKGWNHGVIGIVASRIVEKYYRPVVLLTVEDDIASGSARSVEGFSIFNALSSCSELMDKFGGHDMAAGMTLKSYNVSVLSERLNRFAEKNMEKNTLIRKIKADFNIELKDISVKLIEKLSLLEPYGEGNKEPVFVVDAEVSSIRQIGKEKNHLKLEIKKESSSLDVIGFSLGEEEKKYSQGNEISIIGTLDINEWNNIIKPQLLAKDLKADRELENEFLEAANKIPYLLDDRIAADELIGIDEYSNFYRFLHNSFVNKENSISISKLTSLKWKNKRKIALKIIVMLEVFKELGLITYNIEHITVFFEIFKGKKVELKTSKLYNKWAEQK